MSGATGLVRWSIGVSGSPGLSYSEAPEDFRRTDCRTVGVEGVLFLRNHDWFLNGWFSSQGSDIEEFEVISETVSAAMWT